MASPQTPGSGAPRIRASDAEREQVAHLLRSAMGEGRLTLDEGEERLTAAYQAVYRDEFAPLTADLPAGRRPAPAGPPQADLAAARDRRRQAALVGAAVLVATVLVGALILTGSHVLWPGFLFFLFVFRPFARGRRHR
jgi:hypothetical protein